VDGIVGVYGDVPAAHHGPVGAADPRQRESPAVGDVADHRSDLVGVAAGRDPGGGGLALVDGNGVVVRVGSDLVGGPLDVPHPSPLDGPLEPRR
jgi:hypothetical protein